MRYKCISGHMEDLDGGQTIEPGQIVELTSEEAKMTSASRLIAEGLLIEADPKDKDKKGGRA